MSTIAGLTVLGNYGETVSRSTQGGIDKLYCLVITATLSDRSLREYTCFMPGTSHQCHTMPLFIMLLLVDDNSCSVIQQGQRVEYDLENNITTFYFGRIAATTDILCSLDSRNFGPCKLNTCNIILGPLAYRYIFC